MEETKLKQGEIRLDLIPSSWPLTPIGENKNPYLVRLAEESAKCWGDC
jgi:hypothetical protein